MERVYTCLVVSPLSEGISPPLMKVLWYHRPIIYHEDLLWCIGKTLGDRVFRRLWNPLEYGWYLDLTCLCEYGSESSIAQLENFKKNIMSRKNSSRRWTTPISWGCPMWSSWGIISKFALFWCNQMKHYRLCTSKSCVHHTRRKAP